MLVVSLPISLKIKSTNTSHLTNQYYNFIQQSISEHLISDVPNGTLFSAGLDSSIIASFAEKAGSPYRVGFMNCDGEDDSYYNSYDNQSSLKTDYYQGDEEDEIINLPQLLFMYETINKPDGLILSSLTRKARDKGFKVLLNGDASDEIFSGYN